MTLVVAIDEVYTVPKSRLFDVVSNLKAIHHVHRAYLEEDKSDDPGAYITTCKAYLAGVAPGRYRLVARPYVTESGSGTVYGYIVVPPSAAYDRAQKRAAEKAAFEKRLTDAYREGQKNGENYGSCGFQWIRITHDPNANTLYKPDYNFCLASCTDGDCDEGKKPVEAILRELGYGWVWMWNPD